MSNTKICTKCFVEKPVLEFYLDDPKTGRRKLRCKECVKITAAANYLNAPSNSRQGSGEKQCSTCKLFKPVAEFHSDSRMADGLKSKCKVCLNTAVRVYVRANWSTIQPKRWARIRNDPVLWERVKQRRYAAAKRDRLKHNARAAVFTAIRSGKLVRGPCEIVGCQKPTQAHHDDYSKPLDVRWLCSKHHGETHRKYA